MVQIHQSLKDIKDHPHFNGVVQFFNAILMRDHIVQIRLEVNLRERERVYGEELRLKISPLVHT